jgi:hypothetical protein
LLRIRSTVLSCGGCGGGTLTLLIGLPLGFFLLLSLLPLLTNLLEF